MRTNVGEYTYTLKAVAFLDVLGFQNKLFEFETEAKEYKDAQSISGDAENVIDVLYSQRASDFIETFNSAISKLDPQKFSYYLFSDNICITASNTESGNALVELLLVISELYFEFVQKGFFLRGGIDYGYFIDKATIALGVPLAGAYKIESTQAVFPRIVMSKNFVKQLEVYSDNQKESYEQVFIDSLINKSCEIEYLNVFTHIFRVDNKDLFFQIYSENIAENLSLNNRSENIYLKYAWLAKEFNSFVDLYTSSLAFFDENFEATDDFIEDIKKLKISYGQ